MSAPLRARVTKRLLDEVYDLGIGRSMRRMAELEQDLAAREDTVSAVEDSPARFETPQRYADLRRERGPGELTMMTTWDSFTGTIRNSRTIIDGLESARDSDVEPPARVSEEFVDDFEAHAESLGAASVGYTEVEPEWIFEENGILYDHAVVVTKPMDEAILDEAPSAETLDHVIDNYASLGEIVESLAAYLEDHGYDAQVGHPQMGQVHYPTLAEAANLGYRGKHRMIMTPEAGPRVRVGAVFTNVENFPTPEANDHEWIADYCDNCNLCVRECPAEAIPEETEWDENGRMSPIDSEACFEEFAENYGCAVCVKVCPFNKVGYDRIREQYDRMKQIEAEREGAGGDATDDGAGASDDAGPDDGPADAGGYDSSTESR
jgi:formate hydrogenlyase subunit 6/NADH:ubiquinone oxidoreductase subunit I